MIRMILILMNFMLESARLPLFRRRKTIVKTKLLMVSGSTMTLLLTMTYWEATVTMLVMYAVSRLMSRPKWLILVQPQICEMIFLH